MNLRWTLRARQQLADIGRFISRDKPGAARRWLETLRRRAAGAAERPLAGRTVPELDREDVREVIVRGYRIIYRVSEDLVEVLAVFESHRLLRSALGSPGEPAEEPET
ncbi:MAG TPA: type II toxin-antitoxin system RelE/ParE family toxin [Thermoanaerobaculia bacterium]|nr:type II toxin-antitoxin system RelE/ParE family toxin [Thermoanaerobaculia bacterium]